MIYHYNKLSKYTKKQVTRILKNEAVKLGEVKTNKNYIEASSQNTINLIDAIDKGLYILRDKENHEKNKKYITLNKQQAHFILF